MSKYGYTFQNDQCPYCKGTKYTRCLTCAGSSRVYDDSTKEYICNDCKGRGGVVCEFCGGSGLSYFLFKL